VSAAPKHIVLAGAALRRRLATGFALACAVAAIATAVGALLFMPGEPATIVILVSLAAIGLAAGGCWLAADRFLIAPLARLATNARRAAEGTGPTPLSGEPLLVDLSQSIAVLAGQLAAAHEQSARLVAAATERNESEKRLLEGILHDLSEAVIACGPDHRVLLYNQAALTLLGTAGEVGLDRLLFDLVSREPVLHALDRLADIATQGERPVVPLVCATADSAALLRGKIKLLIGADGKPSGYVLVFADITRPLAELNRRGLLLRETTATLRTVMARLERGDEGLRAEIVALGKRLDEIARGGSDLATWLLPLAEIHSVDLFGRVIGRLRGDGPAVTMVGLPAWLFGDSHALVVALDWLLRRLSNTTGQNVFDLEAISHKGGVDIEIAWAGPALDPAAVEAWRTEVLAEVPDSPSLDAIVRRHGAEMSLHPTTAPDGRTAVRLTNIATRPLRHEAPARPPRPEFYDVDLLQPPTPRAVFEALPLRKVTYVAFDSETTGLRPSQGDEIVALGAVRIVNGRILTGETFFRLVDPGRAIPPESTRFHNITDAMVRGAPPLTVVLPQFRSFVGDAAIIAHNAAFDLKFIRLKEVEASCRFDMPVLDTLLLSRFVHPDLADHDIDSVARRLGIEIEDRHTALGDAMATAAIFVRLIRLVEARGITTLGALVRASNMAASIRLQQQRF
jgi:DNA polymerase III subunit epsilon